MELMHTFVRIVEAGSLSGAARLLGTTQPTVSRRLQHLERALGLRLLQRSTHHMKLTEDGERCFSGARELLANWQAFEAELRGAGDQPAGLLRVQVPHAFGQQVLVPPLTDYLQRYPQVSVDWLLRDQRPDFIAEGIDCAIRAGSVTDPGVVALPLSTVARIVVASPALLRGRTLPGRPAELADLPWMAFRTFYNNEVELHRASDGDSRRLAIRPRLSTDNLYTLRSAALQGLGLAIMSAWLVADDLATGQLIHLLPDWHAAPLPITLTYPYARHYPAKLRRFVDAMRHAMPSVVDAPMGDTDALGRHAAGPPSISP
jgi:DNA-binding transcriptional LysR family regulator